MVLDASALLAFVKQEPGAAAVERFLGEGYVSAVNASEFVQKVDQYGGDGAKALATLEALGVTLEPAGKAAALLAASIYKTTHQYGLSIADRFCLALASHLGSPVCSADKSWLEPAKALGVELVLIR